VREKLPSLQGLALDGAMLERILDVLPYPFLMARTVNGVKHNVFLNERFLEEIGYDRSDIPTINEWFEKAYPDDAYRARVRSEWQELMDAAQLAGHSKATLQVVIETKSRGPLWYEVTSSYPSEVEVVAFVNIHAVKASEARLEIENANRDKLLSVLSHDLRGPIRNLVQLTKLFRNEQLTSAELRQVMLGMHADVAHSLDLLETLLTWTRSNFAKIVVAHEPLDLRQLVFDVVDLLRPALDAKNQRIELNVSTAPIYSDEAILSIVMRNLLSNAMKFSLAGGKIVVESLRQGKELRLAVADEGVGMSEETIHFISTDQPFTKAGTQREQGFGLGLRLCREFLPLINGRLDIESSANGTKMTVVLPVG
jgi:signal transduction histidine kinase